MKKFFTFSAILLASCFVKAQTNSEPLPSSQNSSSTFHPKGTWLVGAGVTFRGLTAKAGNFVGNNLWVGAEAELHRLFSDRSEAGVLARYYVEKGKVRGFAGAGVSYGYFKFDSWNFDNPKPTEKYHSLKLNTLVGAEIYLTPRVSIEGVAKMGWLTETSGYLPSFQASINIALGKSLNKKIR